MGRSVFIAALIVALTAAAVSAQPLDAPRARVYLSQTKDGYSLFPADDQGLRFITWFRDGAPVGYRSYGPSWDRTYRPDGWVPGTTVTLCRWFNQDGVYDLALADCTDITMRLVHLPLIVR